MQRVAEAARNGDDPPAIAFSGISVAYTLKGGRRYVALGEFDDRGIRDAQAALDNGGKPADR